MILDAIYTILSGDAPLVAATGGRIFPLNTPQETLNPCLIFEISSQEPVYSKDGAASVTFTTVEIDVFSNDSPREAHTVALLAKDAMDQFSGLTDGIDIDLIQFEGIDDGVFNAERSEYQVSAGFRIREK